MNEENPMEDRLSEKPMGEHFDGPQDVIPWYQYRLPETPEERRLVARIIIRGKRPYFTIAVRPKDRILMWLLLGILTAVASFFIGGITLTAPPLVAIGTGSLFLAIVAPIFSPLVFGRGQKTVDMSVSNRKDDVAGQEDFGPQDDIAEADE